MARKSSQRIATSDGDAPGDASVCSAASAPAGAAVLTPNTTVPEVACRSSSATVRHANR